MAMNDQEDRRFRAPTFAHAATEADSNAAHQAAIAEFDRLWETGQSRRSPERMRELLAVIEAFERA